ncbi:MAG: type II toxin-antitoxin system VapB family antitoxin [Candidatus Rokuibacteriota bacterium]
MKTTVEIDERLLEEVQKLLGTSTIRDTVYRSMAFVKRQRQLQDLADNLGKIELDLTPEKLRRHRRKRVGHAPR